MGKNFHNNCNSFKKSMVYARQQGFGPFRQRPKRVEYQQPKGETANEKGSKNAD